MNKWKWFWISILSALGLIALIGLLGRYIVGIELLEDQGASWYYWKLPEKEFWPRLTAWSFYIFHQLFVWFFIFKLKVKKKHRSKYNMVLLLSNLGFILLHLFQTHLWYDGLAQDVPVWSSQGSVIVMLVLILIMENDRRGLIFGKPVKGFKSIKSFIREYHGYFIAWAITYTFWYHPMINTSGHLVGFLYLFLLFIQMSLAYTPIHTQKHWTFVLEVLVLFHGTTVAIYQGNNMWPMFGFGFALMAVVTQIYGIGLTPLKRRAIQSIYIIGVLIVFSGLTGHRVISDVHQITWIPIIEYGLVYLVLFLGEPLMKLFKKSNV